MMDILVVENPRNKYIKNMYLNDLNYYHKNSIKMRRGRLKEFNENIYRRKKEKIEKPMPKMLYSSNNFYSVPPSDLIENQKQEIEAQLSQAKPILSDIKNMVENFSSTIDDLYKEDFFITKADDEKEIVMSNDKELKVICSNEIYEQNDVDAIKANDKRFKDNLQFSNYEKFKFSKTGISYPKKYKPNELPQYEGKDKMERTYFNFRKKIKYPKQIYSSIGYFEKSMNKELGKYSSSYGKDNSKARFITNPLMQNYYNIIPIYDIYRDIKYIENRYVDNRFKYKMLPLVNAKLRKLDKLSEVVYKNDHMRKNLNNLLSINNNKIK